MYVQIIEKKTHPFGHIRRMIDDRLLTQTGGVWNHHHHHHHHHPRLFQAIVHGIKAKEHAKTY